MTSVRRVAVTLPKRSHKYEIIVGAGLLDGLGEYARRSLPTRARRIALISNRTVFDIYGDNTMRALGTAGFTVSRWLMRDGERYKTLRSLEQALSFLTDSGLERTDAVVALGGGVVGDLAGFAAAIYMRGLAYLQVPTTLLSQVDASIGGKTAVNSSGGKNIFGVFHQPNGVLIDVRTLNSLPTRELTAGFCECIKQGAISSRKLFEFTNKTILLWQLDESRSCEDEMTRLIAEQCDFKARIVSGDEREAIARNDHRSRKILNFGHTIAHALEYLTEYKRFRHGEAVGHGMLVAGELSKRLGILGDSDLESLRVAVHQAGTLPLATDLRSAEILNALARDKKNVGGHNNWILLERLGRARIVDGSTIAPRILRASIRAALRITN